MSRAPSVLFPLGLISILLLGLQGCFEATDDDYTLPARKYVALGNSLTAGFQSGGLAEKYQTQSYPALLAQAMGINDFEQPLIENPGIGSSVDAQGKPRGPLVLDLARRTLGYAALTKDPADMLFRKAFPRPYNNLGVPGALTADVLSAYSGTTAQSYVLAHQPNPYFDMVIRGASLMNGASMLAQAIAQNPEIVTLEIGNNDILGGVTAGTVVPGVTVTPAPVFRNLMGRIVDSLLAATEAKIVVGNIPKITAIPYVSAIPPFIIDTTFSVVLGPDSLPIPWLTEEDSVAAVLFPALEKLLAKDGVPAALGGTGKKLPANLTLTQNEIATANHLVDEYNAVIDSLVSAHDNRLALADVYGLMNRLNAAGGVNGLTAGHPLIQLLSGKAPNSAFSFDGIHPNSSGYREVAKLFLAKINALTQAAYTLD